VLWGAMRFRVGFTAPLHKSGRPLIELGNKLELEGEWPKAKLMISARY
jgi:hypothetical protein